MCCPPLDLSLPVFLKRVKQSILPPIAALPFGFYPFLGKTKGQGHMGRKTKSW